VTQGVDSAPVEEQKQSSAPVQKQSSAPVTQKVAVQDNSAEIRKLEQQIKDLQDKST